MDNRFLQWLVGGLFLIFAIAVVSGIVRGENISGVTIASVTSLIGVIVGAITLKKDGGKKNGRDDEDRRQ